MKTYISLFSSAGVGCYGFEIRTYDGYTTADVFPTNQETIENNLFYHLQRRRLSNAQINNCLESFREGYDL